MVAKSLYLGAVFCCLLLQNGAWAQNDDFVSAEKTPLVTEFPENAAFYKEITTGVSLEWTDLYLKRSSFGAPTYFVQNRKTLAFLLNHLRSQGVGNIVVRQAGDGEFSRRGTTEIWFEKPSEDDYCDQIGIKFKDGERSIQTMFGRASVNGPHILISGEIAFPKGDVSEEALIGKYKKALPEASFETSEIEEKEEVSSILGNPGYMVAIKYQIHSFENECASTSVKVGKSASLALTTGNHQINENGEYSGSAGATMAKWLSSMLPGRQPDSQAYSELEAEARNGVINKTDIGLATMSFKMWNNLKSAFGAPVVVVKDKRLVAATVVAKGEAQRLEEEAAKKEAAEAEKKRQEEEAARVNDF